MCLMMSEKYYDENIYIMMKNILIFGHASSEVQDADTLAVIIWAG